MDSKQKSRQYFDRHFRSSLAVNGYWRADYRHLMAEIRDLRPDELTDIGCGSGAFLEMIANEIPKTRLRGLDISPNSALYTQERILGHGYAAEGDAEHMPYKSRSCDAVTCIMTLFHLQHPDQAIKEMYRILQPGGRVLINDLSFASLFRSLCSFIFPKLNSGSYAVYGQSELCSMLRHAGFRSISYRKISPFTCLCIAEKPASVDPYSTGY